jgi:predicted nucleic acid-binding protein
MELVQGCFNKEELKTIKSFIRENFFAVIHPNEEISLKAILLLEHFGPSAGLRTVDSLIAASALINNSSIATANLKHYKSIPNLEIIHFKH